MISEQESNFDKITRYHCLLPCSFNLDTNPEFDPVSDGLIGLTPFPRLLTARLASLLPAYGVLGVLGKMISLEDLMTLVAGRSSCPDC